MTRADDPLNKKSCFIMMANCILVLRLRAVAFFTFAMGRHVVCFKTRWQKLDRQFLLVKMQKKESGSRIELSVNYHRRKEKIRTSN